MPKISRTQISKGILAAAVVSLAFGAVARGRDLTGVPNVISSAEEATINRSAKADRTAAVFPAEVPMRTVSLRLESLSNTSVVIRMPVTREARNPSPVPSVPAVRKSGDRKMLVACEPPVSVLAEVAKLLEPGRCVT
jgi:hypothetical protein